MSDKKIRIDGDTAPLKKSIMDISKMLKGGLGKSKIELFSPESKKFLQKEALAQAEKLKQAMDRIQGSISKQAEKLKAVNAGSKEELQIKLKILKAEENLLKVAKQRGELEESEKNIAGAGKERSFGYNFKRTLGIGKLGEAFAERGAMGLAGGLAGGAAIGALLYGSSRISKGREAYVGGIPDRMKLMGRGVDDMQLNDRLGAAQAGLNAQSMRAARLRDIDVFGREGASQESVTRRARFERGYGLDQGTLSGIGAGLRPSMGGKGAEVAVMKLQASLIASGIKDSIGPYLESATNLLEDINEKGFGDEGSILGTFSSLLKSGQGEGKTAQMLSSLDASMRGSSGEANAMYQDVFNRKGYGGGTVGGAAAAIRSGGLFGADLDKYKFMTAQTKDTLRGEGIGGLDVKSGKYTQNIASGMLEELDKIADKDTIDKLKNSKDPMKQKQGRDKDLQRLNLLMSWSGAKSEAGAGNYEGMLQQLKRGVSPSQTKKIQEEMKNMKERTPEIEHLDKINSSLEGVRDILENENLEDLELIGKNTQDMANFLESLLNKIDKLLEYLTGKVDTSKLGSKSDDYQKKSYEVLRQQLHEAREMKKAMKQKGHVKPATPKTVGH